MSLYIDSSNENSTTVSEAPTPVNQSANQSIVRRAVNSEPSNRSNHSQKFPFNGFDDNRKHRPVQHSNWYQSINQYFDWNFENQSKKWKILVAIILTFVVLTQILSFAHDRHHIDSELNQSINQSVNPPNIHSTFELINSLGVHYHLIVIDLLPYASDPLDSSGQSITIRGSYSDSSKFAYPICTFSKVCASQSLVDLLIHNYTVWKFYDTVLPHCNGLLYRRFEICGCFHSNFQARLLPYPYRISARQRMLVNDLVPRMIEERWPGLEISMNHTFRTVVNDQREMPNDDELYTTLELNAEQSHPFNEPERWYADPFGSLPVSGPPSTNDPQPTHLTFLRYSAHYWSVNKWVRVHHIAHWAQKLLVSQASLGHYAHACRHTYRRAQTDTFIEGVDESKNGHYMNQNGQREVEWYIDVQETRNSHDNLTRLEISDDLLMIDCLPAIEGVMFHDSYAPLAEHELSFLNISFAALQSSIDQVGDNILLHRPREYDSAKERFIALHSRDSPLHSSNSLYTPPALDPYFSLSKHVLFAQDLFQQFTPEYLDNVDSWNRALPAPTPVHALACFDRLSFSPLFGTFGDNPYDLDPWKQATSHYFGITSHREHEFRSIQIPAFNDPNNQFLGGLLNDQSISQSINQSPSQSRHLLGSELQVHKSSSTKRDPNVPIQSGPVHETSAAALHLSSCPPPRAVLIHRPDRSILNSGELVRMMRDKYNLEIAIASIDERTTSAEQARVFSDAGLVLAAHSSQMVNVLFSHPGSALIEVTGEFYNIDFARYATSMGIYFRYAFGGQFVDAHQPIDPLMSACMGNLTQCDGDSFCVGKRSFQYCKQFNFFPNKNSPFYANLTAVDIAVKQSIGHVMHNCYGMWGKVRLAKLSTE